LATDGRPGALHWNNQSIKIEIIIICNIVTERSEKTALTTIEYGYEQKNKIK